MQALFGAIQAGGVGVRHAGQPAWPREGEWQVCLAHLLRDARCAMRVRRYRLQRRVQTSAAARDRDGSSARHTERHDAEERVMPIWSASSIACKAGCPDRGAGTKSWRKRIAANRGHLYVFVTNRRRVPYTDNVSERHRASKRDLSQGHRRVPLREWGCRNLRRIPFRRQHSKSQTALPYSAPSALRC